MATKEQIEAAIARIDDIWGNAPARDGRFGNILRSVGIHGVRGISMNLEIPWPVVGIAGANGSGKTTLLQICSAAFVKPGSEVRNYKLGDWVRGALGNETPAVSERASVSFGFWTNDMPVVIPYQREQTRWRYGRRNNPSRNVIFVGIANFAPRIERKDRLHVFRTQIAVRGSQAFTPELLQSISSVLGTTYDEGRMNTVGLAQGAWEENLPQVKRGAYTYGEAHMGAGEQKVIRLLQMLEAVPSRSLILLEEPEITLHPDAQRGLAWYLMSLSYRKGHQIIVATHSTDLFETLPQQARLLLVRRPGGIEVVPRAPKLAAARELSGITMANKALILVEDVAGKTFLSEILRRRARDLFDGCSIVPVGNTNDVYKLTDAFRAEGCRAIGIRDPDIGDAPAEGILSLPGDGAPETLLLDQFNIQACDETSLDGIALAFDRARAAGHGRAGSAWAKAVFPALASAMSLDQERLADRLIDTWIRRHPDETAHLVAAIQRALDW